MLTGMLDGQEKIDTDIKMRNFCKHTWKSPITFSCHFKAASEYPEVILLAYV